MQANYTYILLHTIFSTKHNALRLQEAIAEVENLHGVPKTMAKDWLQAAKERLTLEQALRQGPNLPCTKLSSYPPNRLITAELETLTVAHS